MEYTYEIVYDRTNYHVLRHGGGRTVKLYISPSRKDALAFVSKWAEKLEEWEEEDYTPTPTCKTCGSHFVPLEQSELCPICERALKRLGDYVTPVRHGHWLGKPTGRYEVLKCSVCGECSPTAGIMPRFCANCGARMEQKNE